MAHPALYTGTAAQHKAAMAMGKQPARARASPAASATAQHRTAQTQAASRSAAAAPPPIAPPPAQGAEVQEQLQVLGAARYRQRMRRMNAAVDDVVARLEGAGADDDAAKQTLTDMFAQFDGEAILFETGVLKRLQPQALRLLRELCAAFTARAASEDFTPRQCINVLSTATLLGEADVPLQDAIVRRCVPQLPRTDPEDVGSLCYIFGITGYSSRSLLQGVEGLLLQRHDRFTVRALSKSVWMLGRTQYNNENVASLVQEVVRRCLEPSASPTDLVYGMWATGQHEEVSEALVDKALDVVPPHVDSLTGGELAKLAWALVQQDVGTTRLFDKIADAAAATLGQMYPRDIAKLAWALGQVNIGGSVLAAPLAAQIERHLEGFTRAELDMLIEAYNHWGLHDDTVAKVSHQLREGVPA